MFCFNSYERCMWWQVDILPGQDEFPCKMTARSHTLGKATLGPLVLHSVSPEERAARSTLEKAEAAKRVKEAEARLREAIENFHDIPRGTDEGFGVAFSGRHPLCPHGDSCVANAVGSLCQSFLLSFQAGQKKTFLHCPWLEGIALNSISAGKCAHCQLIVVD